LLPADKKILEYAHRGEKLWVHRHSYFTNENVWLNENVLGTTDTGDHISHAEHGQRVEKFENLPVCCVVVTVFPPVFPGFCPIFFPKKTCKGENVLGTTDTGYPILTL